MTPQRSAADRIRPILQAMENSINAARRSRVKEPSAPTPQSPSHVPTPSLSVIKTPAPSPSPPPAPVKIERALAAPNSQPILSQPDAPQRLKAKPKRVNSAFASPFEQPNYRSQAG